MTVVNRNKWLRGNIDSSFLCDDEGNKDVLGFFMSQRGVDDNTLYNEVDPLQLLYTGDISGLSILPLLVQIELDDPEYPGLHWKLNPVVNDIMLVNDAELNTDLALSVGECRGLTNEFEREARLVYLFSKLNEELTFEN